MKTFNEKFISNFSRFAVFLIYFWFGALKVLGLSPASPLVSALLDKTMPGMGISIFLVLFGLFEMFIAILFLSPKTTRLGTYLVYFHIFLTALPLILLPHLVWTGFLTPTLEGQYIIKNILILAIVFNLNRELNNKVHV